MGFAKYCEDNNRLTEEREYYREHISDIEWHCVTKGSNRKKTKVSISSTVAATFINSAYLKPDLSKVIRQNNMKKTQKGDTSKILMCKDCGGAFEFSAGEQKFFEKKHWSAPVRCKDCREKKAMLQAMGR